MDNPGASLGVGDEPICPTYADPFVLPRPPIMTQIKYMIHPGGWIRFADDIPRQTADRIVVIFVPLPYRGSVDDGAICDRLPLGITRGPGSDSDEEDPIGDNNDMGSDDRRDSTEAEDLEAECDRIMGRGMPITERVMEQIATIHRNARDIAVEFIRTRSETINHRISLLAGHVGIELYDMLLEKHELFPKIKMPHLLEISIRFEDFGTWARRCADGTWPDHAPANKDRLDYARAVQDTGFITLQQKGCFRWANFLAQMHIPHERIPDPRSPEEAQAIDADRDRQDFHALLAAIDEYEMPELDAECESEEPLVGTSSPDRTRQFGGREIVDEWVLNYDKIEHWMNPCDE